MTKAKDDSFLASLEREVKQMLKDKDLTATERLKAVEAGVKLLAIRHKLDTTGEVDGSFFASK